MDDRLGARRADDLVEWLANVVHVQRRAGGHLLALPVREVVDDVHLVTPRKQRVDDVGADETGTAGDDDPHRRNLPAMFITLEGLDGSGKTTQATLLGARLEADRSRSRR